MDEHAAHPPTLAETVARLAGTVETLSSRVEKVERLMEQFLKIVTAGKGFLAGVLAVVLLAVFGAFGALKQIRDFFG